MMTIAEWLEEKGRKQGQQEGEPPAASPPECWRAASNVKPCRSSPG
jgi:hypothetical protein